MDGQLLLYCLEAPSMDLEKFHEIINLNKFVPACYNLLRFDWTKFYELLANWAIKHPKLILNLLPNCGFPTEDAESIILKHLLAGSTPENQVAFVIENGFKLNKSILSEMLMDAQLITDEWLVKIVRKYSEPKPLESSIKSALRQLFSNGHLPDLRLGVYLIRTFEVPEKTVNDCLLATEFDREMFYLLRKYHLPVKTLFGLRFNGLPDEYWKSLLELYDIDHEIIANCFHDVAVGGAVDQFEILNLSKSAQMLGSVNKFLNWQQKRPIPKLSSSLETNSVRSCNSILSMGMVIRPNIFQNLATVIFESAPTKRFIYLLAQIEKNLWDNDDELDEWVATFETNVLQNDQWIYILSNHTEIYSAQPLSPISLNHYFGAEKNGSIEIEEELALDDVEIDDNASVKSSYSTSSISSSIMNAYSSVKNTAVNIHRDAKYKELRRFYYTIDQLVAVLERKKVDKIRKEMNELTIKVGDLEPKSPRREPVYIPIQSEVILKDGTIVMKPMDEQEVSFQELPFNQWHSELKELEATKVTKRPLLTKYLNKEALTNNLVFNYFGIASK